MKNNKLTSSLPSVENYSLKECEIILLVSVLNIVISLICLKHLEVGLIVEVLMSLWFMTSAVTILIFAPLALCLLNRKE